MCGRFYVDDEMLNEIEKILNRIDRDNLKKGDIYPTDKAVIIKSGEENSGLLLDSFSWGYKLEAKSNVIFNARLETVSEKPLFRNDFISRRCLVPAKGFYEWDKGKSKYLITQKSSGVLYMAGIYRTTKDESQFTILTEDSRGELKEIHERMPLILEEKSIKTWIENGSINKVVENELKIELF